MPPLAILLPQIISGIQAAITAAPGIIKVVQGVKLQIEGLFEGKVITVEQQAALYAHVDSIVALHKSGMLPAHWQKDPDPEAGTATATPA